MCVVYSYVLLCVQKGAQQSTDPSDLHYIREATERVTPVQTWSFGPAPRRRFPHCGTVLDWDYTEKPAVLPECMLAEFPSVSTQ